MQKWMALVFDLGSQFIENVEKLEITLNNWSKTKSLKLDGYYSAYCFLRPFVCYKILTEHEHRSQHWYRQLGLDNTLRK